MTHAELTRIRNAGIISQPIPWDRILEQSAHFLGRALTYDDARQILGEPFMRFVGHDNDVQTWCVVHRLTFKPGQPSANTPHFGNHFISDGTYTK